MSLQVQWATYGALAGGSSDNAQAYDVTHALQQAIGSNAGVVACNNTSFGDPSPGNDKHFGAVVNRNGQNFFFACNEGQTIDFNHQGGAVMPHSNLQVLYAVYGALPGGVLSEAKAADVGAILQDQLNSGNGVVACNNATLGGDPAPGYQKHFAAEVKRNGVAYDFACQEGQTINFNVGGGH